MCFVVVVATSERGGGRCSYSSQMDDPSGNSSNGAYNRVARGTEADDFSSYSVFLVVKGKRTKCGSEEFGVGSGGKI